MEGKVRYWKGGDRKGREGKERRERREAERETRNMACDWGCQRLRDRIAPDVQDDAAERPHDTMVRVFADTRGPSRLV